MIQKDAFWKNIEEDTGYPIEAKGLCEYSKPEGGAPLWGLLYLTRDRFVFKHFPQRNWLTLMMNSGEEPFGMTEEIPFESIRSIQWKAPENMGFLRRFLTPGGDHRIECVFGKEEARRYFAFTDRRAYFTIKNWFERYKASEN